MPSLIWFKYQDGTQGACIRYRQNRKHKKYTFPKNLSKQWIKVNYHKFIEEYARCKLEKRLFFNPLEINRESIKLSEFQDWFFKNFRTTSRGTPPSVRTIQLYETCFQRLYQITGDVEIGYLNQQIDLIEEGLKQYAKNTKSITIRQLRSAFNFGIKKGLIKSNPFREITAPKTQPKTQYFTRDEMDRIFENIENFEVKKAFMLARGCALRRIEIAQNVKWENMYFSEGYGILEMGKTGENQHFPIFPIARKFLKPLKSEGYVVNIGESAINRNIREARKKAGIDKPGTNINTIRHTFARELINQGMSLFKVKILMRHTNISTTELYPSISTPELKKDILKYRI